MAIEVDLIARVATDSTGHSEEIDKCLGARKFKYARFINLPDNGNPLTVIFINEDTDLGIAEIFFVALL